MSVSNVVRGTVKSQLTVTSVRLTVTPMPHAGPRMARSLSIKVRLQRGRSPRARERSPRVGKSPTRMPSPVRRRSMIVMEYLQRFPTTGSLETQSVVILGVGEVQQHSGRHSQD